MRASGSSSRALRCCIGGTEPSAVPAATLATSTAAPAPRILGERFISMLQKKRSLGGRTPSAPVAFRGRVGAMRRRLPLWNKKGTSNVGFRLLRSNLSTRKGASIMARRTTREWTWEQFDDWHAASKTFEAIAEAADEDGGPS